MNLAMLTLWAAGYDLPPETKPMPKKGCCRHCGKHIGKGLHFHEKACKGAK